MEQVLWFVLGLGLGLALDFLLVKVMLRSIEKRLLVLELALEKAREEKKKSLGAELSRQQMEKHQWKSWGQG
jgi:hypothetical protein